MQSGSSPQVGFTNDGQLVVKNRWYRRQKRTTAQLDGLSKKYYTTKQTKVRKRNGKTIKIRKKSGK